VDLNPAGFGISYAFGASNGLQVGNAADPFTNGSFHAFVWFGSAASGIDLHTYVPTGWKSSSAFSIDGSTVYGIANDASDVPHAVRWTNVPEPASLGLVGVAGLLFKRPALRRRVHSPVGTTSDH
jgi:hypothetical protein